MGPNHSVLSNEIAPTLTIFYQFNPWMPSIGGIQTLIKTFVKYAPDRFHVRLVGTGSDDGPSGEWQESEFVGRAIQFFPLFSLEEDNSRKLVPTTVRYTAALLGKDFASDFMHFHRLEPTIAAWRWPGHKTLFVHNDIYAQIQANAAKNAILWQRFAPAYFWLEGQLLGQFDRILSCNSESARLYRQRYEKLADRVKYYKNAFDGELFYPLSSAERQQQRQALAGQLGLSQETKFLLFAGRLHPQKDPMLMLRALAAMSDSRVHLLIAGDGDLREAIHGEIQKLGLSRQVTLLGALTQDRLVPLLQQAHACVLTSAYEGLPIIALEALACGTPVVTTDCGETPKLLAEGSGIVCRDREPQSIAEAWKRVLNTPDYFPQSACTRAAQPYSARNVVEQIYEEMLMGWHQRMQAHGNEKILV